MSRGGKQKHDQISTFLRLRKQILAVDPSERGWIIEGLIAWQKRDYDTPVDPNEHPGQDYIEGAGAIIKEAGL